MTRNSRTSTRLPTISGPRKTSGRPGAKLNEVGEGSLTVQRDHPAVDDLVVGNVVRVYDGATLVWAWTITERTDVRLGRDAADETVTVEGEGLLGRWGESTVAPWFYRRPNSCRPGVELGVAAVGPRRAGRRPPTQTCGESVAWSG